MRQRLIMRSKWCGDSNHSIGWMSKGDSLTLDFVVLKLFTLTLLPSTMWPEHGLPCSWGLMSLIITSPNSDGGCQLYPPSHPQLIIKLKKWKSTLIKDPRVNSPLAPTAWWISRPSKHILHPWWKLWPQPPTLRYSEDERINQFQLNQTVIYLIYILLKLKIIIGS